MTGRSYEEFMAELGDRLREYVDREYGDTAAADPGGQQPELTVKKLGYVVLVPDEELMEAGLIPDTRPRVLRVREPYRVTSWTLARWQISTVMARARLRVGSWIAGVDLDEERDRDDEW